MRFQFSNRDYSALCAERDYAQHSCARVYAFLRKAREYAALCAARGGVVKLLFANNLKGTGTGVFVQPNGWARQSRAGYAVEMPGSGSRGVLVGLC